MYTLFLGVYLCHGYTLVSTDDLNFCDRSYVKTLQGPTPAYMQVAVICHTNRMQTSLQLDTAPATVGPWDFYFAVDKFATQILIDDQVITPAHTDGNRWQRVTRLKMPSNTTYHFSSLDAIFAIPQIYLTNPKYTRASPLSAILASVFLGVLGTVLVILLYRRKNGQR